MKNATIGYPRIGEFRELKFAVEKYFKGENSQEDLEAVANGLKEKHWASQKGKVDYISSNDFSFYDNFLDLAILFNLIPRRYQELDLCELDTYFAMARGYQSGECDVKALAMKKWFDTNYHYQVIEIEDDANICLRGSKPFDEYLAARKSGIETKPMIIGPFTLFKLARFTGEKRVDHFVEQTVKAYGEMLERFETLGCVWVQLDEPALVKDLAGDDIELFKSVYEKLLERKGCLKILLQTYFDDVRDCYDQILELDFDGLGLDFVAGSKNRELVINGPYLDKTLFAGVVNGKNIWKNNYNTSLKLLKELEANCKEVVISTSCSLLHVPYTLANEPGLKEGYKRHFAFAKEKLDELLELKQLSASGDLGNEPGYRKNKELFGKRDCVNERVQAEMNNLAPADFRRGDDFDFRAHCQKKYFNLPLLPTTTIGSFPQTGELKRMRSLYRKGKVKQAEYEGYIQGLIRQWIEIQEDIGLDVLVHGEFERNDMVEYFGANLEGYLFSCNGWVQSYGTRAVKPPIIWGDVAWVRPLSCKWISYAQSLSAKPVKGMLTGPVTMLNWSFPREDITSKEMALQLALAIRQEVDCLEKQGIKIIQIDEAALREKLPLKKSRWHDDYLDWAIEAFRLCHSRVAATTQIHTHMCYSEFGDILPEIDAMDADVITFEASRSDMELLKKLREAQFKTAIGPGIYDIHSPRIPPVDELALAINKIKEEVGLEKLWINPDCGLKTRGETETVASLKNMVQTTRETRKNM